MNTNMSTSLNGTTPEDLERSIAQQREELAKTIDALQAKFDVKTRARHQAEELRHQVEDLRQHPVWLGAAAATVVATVAALVVWRRRR